MSLRILIFDKGGPFLPQLNDHLLSIVAVICLSIPTSASAESLYYNRVSQVVEVSSGKFVMFTTCSPR